MNKATVYAKNKAVRTSVKKLSPVMDIVRGKSVEEATRILTFDHTKASDIILKTLNSAVANARHNLNLNEKDLYVSDLHAGPGPSMKRFRFVGRMHVNPIIKRTAHIVVGLSERKKG